MAKKENDIQQETPVEETVETAEVTDEVVARLMEVEEVVDVGAMASSSSMGLLTGGGNSATNATTVYVTLAEEKERDNIAIAKEMEGKLADIAMDIRNTLYNADKNIADGTAAGTGAYISSTFIYNSKGLTLESEAGNSSAYMYAVVTDENGNAVTEAPVTDENGETVTEVPQTAEGETTTETAGATN